MNEYETLDYCLKRQRLRIQAHIENKTPFKYLDMINQEHFGGIFEPESMYNLALDCYNYYKQNGVINQAKEEAILRTYENMLKIYSEME